MVSMIEQYGQSYLNGIWLTIQLTFIASIVGLVLAIPLAFCAMSKNPLIRLPVAAFSYFFRGTPLLIQIYLLYFGLSQFPEIRKVAWLWSILKHAYWCAIIAFTLNTCAYTIEIFKGAFKSTPRGEVEAAIAMGMSKFQIFRRIIFPSGVRRALPAYSNEVIFMLHGTAQASVITLLDVMGVSQMITRESLSYVTPYLIAALIYLCLTFTLVGIFKWCESRWLSYLHPQR